MGSASVIPAVPEQLVAGGVLGSLGVLLGLLVKLQLGGKKLEVADTADLRDHYAEELTSLRRQIIDMGEHHLGREREIDDRWRRLLAESEERHAECVRQRDALSARVGAIEERFIGTVRQFLHFQQRIVEAIPADMKTPEIIHAVESLQPFTEDISEIERKAKEPDVG